MTTTATTRVRCLALLALVLLAAACAGLDPPDGAADAASGDSPPAGVPPVTQQATVTRIVDGDTIWVEVQHGGGPLPAGAAHKVRLLAYDAPEDTATTECGGPEATAALRRLIPVGSRVRLTADQQDTDPYGRFLRYVHTDDGTFVNRQMVRRGHGHAVTYQPNDAHMAAVRRAERAAQGADRGVWGPPCRGR